MNSEEGYLVQLEKWAKKWQMKCNLDKHEVFYFSKLNQDLHSNWQGSGEYCKEGDTKGYVYIVR